MRENIHSSNLTLSPFDNKRLSNLCSRFDEHIKHIEKRLNVTINNRGHDFQIKGDKPLVDIADKILDSLYKETLNDSDITPNKVHLLISQIGNGFLKKHDETLMEQELENQEEQAFCVPTPKGLIKPRSHNQEKYIKQIFNHDINFGIGPAGTGKTFLAVACAVAALDQEKVNKIILVRPAVEAGERLGFLPGDLSQKIDPYLKPLYDALNEMLGFDKVERFIEKGIIEIAPLAYMRGRTLSNAFILLDESQNATQEQMKMFLTRIGFGSTAIITGDVTQTDLPAGKVSGLMHVIKILERVNGISFSYFDSTDVVRHPVVKKIVAAYEKFEKSGSNSSAQSNT